MINIFPEWACAGSKKHNYEGARLNLNEMHRGQKGKKLARFD